MLTLLAALTLLVLTPPLAAIVLVAAALGVEDRPGTILDWAPRFWASALVRMAGLRVRLHGEERIQSGEPRVYVSNHVSWYDVFVLASRLPRYKFVAKAELFRIPIFGPGARAVGTIPIERENRMSAFDSYRVAADRIRAGDSVVVYPEGTRGATYSLRPFKKGPFVLAIAAGVPIVPTIVHGTIDVMPRGSWRIRSAVVDVHFLEPVPTAGLTYADRERLMTVVWQRMADALHELYGVESDHAGLARATRRRSGDDPSGASSAPRAAGGA